jgi:hypothetical protein
MYPQTQFFTKKLSYHNQMSSLQKQSLQTQFLSFCLIALAPNLQHLAVRLTFSEIDNPKIMHIHNKNNYYPLMLYALYYSG